MSLTPEAGLLFALAAAALAVALAAVALALGLARHRSGPADEALGLLQQQLEALRAEIGGRADRETERLDRLHASIGGSLATAAQSVADLRHRLGALEEATDRILEVGKSVAGIENLLRAPKLRGVLGELLLGELLAQALPASLFELQHTLATGERVDAVVRVGDAVLPVDAKFPLDNLRRALEAEELAERDGYRRAFARDFRKHVDAVASKYIAPERGTLPLALLYVPAENVYQQGVLGDPSLTDYALARRVVPVGPLAFYAFLQTILLGWRSLGVPARSGAILARLDQMALELEAVARETGRLGRHLDAARATAGRVDDGLRRIGETLERARAGPDGPAREQE